MDSFIDGSDMPIGFGMALVMNVDAMNSFARMNDKQKRAIIERAHNASSREEMQSIINSIVEV